MSQRGTDKDMDDIADVFFDQLHEEPNDDIAMGLVTLGDIATGLASPDIYAKTPTSNTRPTTKQGESKKSKKTVNGIIEAWI